MTRNEFIRRLKSGLGGMPAAEQAEKSGGEDK